VAGKRGHFLECVHRVYMGAQVGKHQCEGEGHCQCRKKGRQWGCGTGVRTPRFVLFPGWAACGEGGGPTRRGGR